MGLLDIPIRRKAVGYSLATIIVGIIAVATATTGGGARVEPGWNGLDDVEILVVASPPPGEPGSSVIIPVDPLTGESGASLFSLPAHAGVAFTNRYLYVVTPGQSQDDARIERLAADTLQSAAVRGDLPTPWVTKSGQTDQTLWVVETGGREFLVFAHFVRGPDSRSGTGRNEFAVSLLLGDSLEVIDTLDPDGCHDGRVVEVSSQEATIWCPSDSVLLTLGVSATGFDVGEANASVTAPVGAPTLYPGDTDGRVLIERGSPTSFPPSISVIEIDGRRLRAPIEGALPVAFRPERGLLAMSAPSGREVLFVSTDTGAVVIARLDLPEGVYVEQIAFKP
jgi:hypothetical protein